MPKPASRTHSRYAREAAALLGVTIREARAERRMTVAEVAERAGVSRGLVTRIEQGDMGCAVGAVFEVAAIVGVRLFDADPAALTDRLGTARDRLTLLPQTVRPRSQAVKDDF